MTRGKFDTKEAIRNPNIVALFGYLVRCNDQIHDFQKKIIKNYLERKDADYSFVHDVIFFKEDAVSYETALEGLKAESDKIKSELLFYLVVVSEIDGITDFEEKEFFDALLSEIGVVSSSVIISEAKKKANTERKRLKKENSVNHTGKRANPNSTDNLFRITQKEYIQAISRCRKIAKEDYLSVKPVCDSIIDKGLYFHSNLTAELETKTNFHPEVAEALASFSSSIESEVFDEVKAFKREFAKKETTVEDFTIALIGRTKAGKSTLRTVLTGQGKENIGKGAQRTTRINDIYEWNHLRIIDTPGIDAGSDVENEDRKIAEKVIGEADIICYIASSDGLPKNAREFAVNLAKRNKPVIVLVNYKSNIVGESRFNRFIKNPTGWLNSDSANAIEGYFYPIKRLAEESGVDKLISCKAVFLYAELLSKDEKYKEYAKLLSDSSGVNEFLVLLKDAVVNKGTFLRSKTIIDDTIVECIKWVERIEKLMLPISSMHKSLLSEKNNNIAKIKKAQRTLLSGTKKTITTSFDKLATVEAITFAEANYNQKTNLTAKWNEHCQSIGFYDDLKKEIEGYVSQFGEEVSSVMNDLFEDLQFEMPSVFTDEELQGSNGLNLPIRELLRFLGRGLSMVGSFLLKTPVGLVLEVVGGFLSFISEKFQSKAKREKKKKDSLYSKINEAVNEQAEEFLAEAMKQIETCSNQCFSEALGRYDELLNGLKFTSDYCEDLINEMNYSVNTLNICFAERILQYITGEEITVSAVNRQYGKSIEIYPTQYCDTSACNMSKVQGLLNEQIIIYEEV